MILMQLLHSLVEYCEDYGKAQKLLSADLSNLACMFPNFYP